MNSRHLGASQGDHSNLHLVADARIATNTISPCRCDAIAVLSIEIQRNSKLNRHDFRHEVLILWN